MSESEARGGVTRGCAGCAGCPLGRLIAEGKVSGKVDPERFRNALERKRRIGGCATTVAAPRPV